MKESSLPTPIKRASGKRKLEKELRVLLALVEHYIRTGRPVGSNTLKESVLDDLSPATIRNYFASLEEEGYVAQLHTSGGRIPTAQGYRAYADHYSKEKEPRPSVFLDELPHSRSKEITLFLQEAAEWLSQTTRLAVCISSPRFDRDFVTAIKLVPLDLFRGLCVVMTDFGVVRTETLRWPEPLSEEQVKKIENYFMSRLQGKDEDNILSTNEKRLSRGLYSELMLRYVVGYTHPDDDEVYRTGLARLLSQLEAEEASSLMGSLSLFEDKGSMQLLMREALKAASLKYWIGEESQSHSAVLAIPYKLGAKMAGAIVVLGPTRLPYRSLFPLLEAFAEALS